MPAACIIANSIASSTTMASTNCAETGLVEAVMERVYIRYTFPVRAQIKPARVISDNDAWTGIPHSPVRFGFHRSRRLSPDAETVLPFGCTEGNQTNREQQTSGTSNLCHGPRKRAAREPEPRTSEARSGEARVCALMNQNPSPSYKPFQSG